eukprot:489298-Amphidinium_carterae.1
MSTSPPAKHKTQEADVDCRTKAKGDKAQMASDSEHFTHIAQATRFAGSSTEWMQRVHQCAKCLQTGRKGKGRGKGSK